VVQSKSGLEEVVGVGLHSCHRGYLDIQAGRQARRQQAKGRQGSVAHRERVGAGWFVK
jgi:hypothetical protein